MNITLYQCIPSYKPLPTVRLIKSLKKINCEILLDIEDSIQDIENPERTPLLKRQARNDLIEIIGRLPDEKFSLRINPVYSKEFENDISLLRTIGNTIETVFIPKIESADELKLFFNEFKNRFKLNIIIETKNGVNNINKILNSDYSKNIEFVFFGNYDYNLDANTYPIIEQNDCIYWETVEPVISNTEQNNFKFGNSPYANIADTNCLRYSFIQLLKLCKRDFAIMSLHKTQTIHFQKLMDKVSFCEFLSEQTNHRDDTLDEFIKYKLKGRSFALNNKKRIITPQEYTLIKRKQNE